ncbi:MAG TPA: 50S ribosomal protein L3 [Candidatus Parcubacteria bacterium]|nr:50S ribosomal protein L3 [Candidatus Parcubacteria bacterium]
MMKFILGKNLGMSQMFDEKGNVIPVTLIEAGPCYITQIKTEEKDGYKAIQIGFEKLKEKKVKKPQKNKPYRYIREFRVDKNKNDDIDLSKIKINDKIDVSVFQEGDKLKISAVSKGKGFAGAMKKWGFHGQSASHGVKHTERAIGSIGSMFPQRVWKGKKMPGRMGSQRVTVKNLKLVKVDPENGLLAVKGSVPGRKGSLLEIKEQK